MSIEAITEEYRGIKIRCGYDIQTDLHDASFDLPPRASEFQGAVKLTTPLPAGTLRTSDQNPTVAIKKAKGVIDLYLDY